MNPEEKMRTTIGEDVEITGNIKCESGIQLNGKLNGDLTCGGTANIGAGCTVKGNLSSDTVSVMGQVNGNITARDKIELKAAARLHGDIRAKRLTVEDGVTFVGKVEVNPSGVGSSKAVAEPKPAPTAPEESDDPEKEVPETQGKGIFRR